MLNFANQNLQNRSFRGQNLAGSDFQSADIRGCNFKNAQLHGANFTGAKVGQSRRQKIGLGLLMLGVAVISIDTISRLVSNTISQSPLDATAAHVPVLAAILSATGISSALSAVWRNSKRGQISRIITAILWGTLIGFTAGFFYGSAWRDSLTIYLLHHPTTSLLALYPATQRHATQRLMLAKQGMLLGAIAVLLLTRFRHTTAFRAAISLAGTVVSYGATFFWGTTAGAFLSTHELGLGLIIGSVALLYLWCTTRSLSCLSYEWNNATGTSFRGADLTEATFENVELRHTDFSNAIGYLSPTSRSI
ncbi:pentapeptide repeat-containing protein [Myxacorys almedinensis]|uniref:Pentapeptide repeat-containing protein n=1 Tax=Myxacorys almedinensis A TaxID=2690445 RepID=A0A8J7Z0L3_9CYAN|nr:pentapeptide repeat-containing protein [Myxacorys almedinensis]NDJ17514.1 hypothetical protein [Myxacorys almedinensis A]